MHKMAITSIPQRHGLIPWPWTTTKVCGL